MTIIENKPTGFRVLKVIMAFLLVLGVSPLFTSQPAEAEGVTFIDIQKHWARDTIRWAAQNGIVQGYGDGMFRPNGNVTEPEFLSMLFKAYPDIKLPAVNTKAPWYDNLYQAANEYNWPVMLDFKGTQFNRGQVARILAASQGKVLDVNSSVQFLLDNKLASGKTSNTISGFGADDKLTRAEALVFIKRALNQNLTLGKAAAVKTNKEFTVRGLTIGNTEQTVLAQLGQPARKDVSEYGFTWYIYNKDYANYVQVGVQNGKVVALYSTSDNWSSKKGLRQGSESSGLNSLYGKPLNGLLKGNVLNLFAKSNTEYVFEIDNAYTTIFLDKHNNNRVMAVYIVDKAVEDAAKQIYGTPSQALRQSYERQVFDLANAARANFGKPAFVWDDLIAGTARKHSKDMAVNRYFDHNNLRGESPFDRMEADGIAFRMAAENIAAGQRNAIFVHAGWMNSLGHRKNVLGDTKRLGVGVEFGGEMKIYYTQNFYTK
ncbi:CAP-associated domain-containing protein [Paenibacillus abyssi]|uniref:SLH domain-containing protein n=1 Tax=Paenibacillus abyssi TaxID=1340531 RepID=A0A917D2Y1_9BACL|nr:CAP-associated domain-containing protein [Paenibacillus abyssi]GGG06376.1 hypothetical protein GCM10010916_24150 [Paenibacillus abyssi]